MEDISSPLDIDWGKLTTRSPTCNIINQNDNQWDAITAFPRDINTTIVVTTKIQGVAKFGSLPNYYVYNMGKLSDDHSKQLLLKAADLEKYSDSSLSDSKAILKICDGQPLALSTVGKFMRKRSLMEGPDWDGICNQLRCHLGSDDSLDRVHQALMHEYTSLPSCAIKACLLYFAMFPSDHRVKPQRIMRQWLAEGFVEPENSLGDTADKCFEELLDRSIVHPIEVSNNKTVKTCRTYGMMHEYVMFKSLSENLIMLCDNGNYQNSKSNGNFQTTQHRCLSLRDSSISDSSSLDSDLSLVRTLIVFGKAGSMLNFDSLSFLTKLYLQNNELPGFVTRLRGLKELCLQSTKLKAALLTALGTLEHLKYLKLIAGELDDFVLQRNALPSLVCIRFVLKSPTLPKMEHGAMPILKSLQLLCDGLNGLSGLQINYFTHLREVILDAGVEVNSTTIQNWQDAAANHPNRPKVILLNALDSTEGASIQGSAESWQIKMELKPICYLMD
ncbi:unnamed protein product [Miscanthus lutarioriparius]|uniref:Disease resistance protein winged helix domain-containing protein n=1 Tax=Miscanthus lutarioriparius TaxID=422564 RepID=A0A811Q9W6_9POAL|nr:unnamed protein product [Miscanthus lutarioriparius]